MKSEHSVNTGEHDIFFSLGRKIYHSNQKKTYLFTKDISTFFDKNTKTVIRFMQFMLMQKATSPSKFQQEFQQINNFTLSQPSIKTMQTDEN